MHSSRSARLRQRQSNLLEHRQSTAQLRPGRRSAPLREAPQKRSVKRSASGHSPGPVLGAVHSPQPGPGALPFSPAWPERPAAKADPSIRTSMSELTIQEAQADMRRAYLSGAPGVLVSGLVWLVAGGVAVLVSDRAAVIALLLGGAAIHPLAVVLTRLLGRSGKHSADNALGSLAAEGTFWLLAGCAIAYGMHVLRIEWFFPAMLLVIGGRYLTFHTLFGLRAYWVCGAVLCVAGLGLALARAPAVTGAFAGAFIETVFAAVLFVQARHSVAA